MKLQTCFECGNKLKKETKDQVYTYKGKEVTIKDVKGLYCTGCDEVIIDKSDIERVDQALTEFRQQVNIELVNPDFIKSVREKLKLGRTEAGKVFGGGKNIFNQYETGKTQPPVSLIKLFKILDKHPDLLEEIIN